MTLTTYGTTIDLRAVAPRERRALVVSTWRGLVTGETMDVVDDHDPAPLFDAFGRELPGGFAWAYTAQGPDTWRVRIRKLAGDRQTCCGACGGA